MSMNPPTQSKPIPKWWLYGGGIAAILGLYVLVKKSTSGTTGSTVAAGTSINAALGSLQEQMLNAQGDISKANVGISQIQTQQSVDSANAAAYASQIYNNVSAQGTQAYVGIQGLSLMDQYIRGDIAHTSAMVGQTYNVASTGAAYSSIASQATDPTSTATLQHLTTVATGTN